MLNRNYPIIFSLLFMMLAIGYWLYDTDLHPGTQKKTVETRQNADYFMDQASITQYDARGQLEYQLSARNISHYPHNDTTLLSEPQMISYRKPGQVTRADATNGKLLPGNKTLVLWNNVILVQDMTRTGKKVQLTTEYLTLDSSQGTATTDKPVLITSDNGTVKAIGMTTDYEQGLISLKSRVRGTYESR